MAPGSLLRPPRRPPGWEPLEYKSFCLSDSSLFLSIGHVKTSNLKVLIYILRQDNVKVYLDELAFHTSSYVELLKTVFCISKRFLCKLEFCVRHDSLTLTNTNSSFVLEKSSFSCALFTREYVIKPRPRLWPIKSQDWPPRLYSGMKALARSYKTITTLMQIKNSIVVSFQCGYLSSF